jgi:uncharacterized membrane protein YdjX (TVP38/TMEM64 family)|tara:strand:- start:443 stop:1060 length:618 start_codon:yes stop_codon:yes gene_type:complete
MKDATKSFLAILVIAFLFILSSYLARENIEFIKNLIGNDFIGITIYILITIIAIIIAPISMMPLIPVASNLWGWFLAGVFTFTGWTIGSFIVFFISRKYGVPLIKKFISLKKIKKFESKIPKENIFLDIVLLRMIIPVDILSYALGLFSGVGFKTYAFATMLGILPFTFVFSYLGEISLKYQVIGFIVVIILIAIISSIHIKKHN